jgi:hypothetical protein
MPYATQEHVDRIEARLRLRQTSMKQDLTAIGDSVVELLEGQKKLKTDVGQLKTDVGQLKTDVGQMKTDVGRTDANVRAIMGHLGVPEVEVPGPDDPEAA